MKQNINAKNIGIVAGDNTKIIYQSPLQALFKPSLCTFIGFILTALAIYLVSMAAKIGLMPLAMRALDLSVVGAVSVAIGEYWDFQINKTL